jgi:hypothetical protein
MAPPDIDFGWEPRALALDLKSWLRKKSNTIYLIVVKKRDRKKPDDA